MANKTYFYRFKCDKTDKTGAYPRIVYDRSHYGTFTSDEDTGDPFRHVFDMAKEKHPDADNIDITALNLI